MPLYRVIYKLIEPPEKGKLRAVLFEADSLDDARSKAKGIVSLSDSPGKFEITSGPDHASLPTFFTVGGRVDV